MIQSCNAQFAIRKENYVIRNLMSILILTLCLSHCAISTTDVVNIGAAIYTGIEDDR